MRRTRLTSLLAVILMVVLSGVGGIASAQTATPVWNSSMTWQPSLAESGDALMGLLNQIDATCSVDVDVVTAANGTGPEGSVYAFAVNWRCPAGTGDAPINTWQSAIIWQPSLIEAGDALAAHLNQIDATCSVEVDTIVPTVGTGPEGPVYAFLVTWAC